MTTDVEA